MSIKPLAASYFPTFICAAASPLMFLRRTDNLLWRLRKHDCTLFVRRLRPSKQLFCSGQ